MTSTSARHLRVKDHVTRGCHFGEVVDITQHWARINWEDGVTTTHDFSIELEWSGIEYKDNPIGAACTH